MKAATGGRLSARLTSHPMPVGAVDTGSVLFAEYYTYQTPGASKFVLSKGSAAYQVFHDEAETLWRDAKQYEL